MYMKELLIPGWFVVSAMIQLVTTLVFRWWLRQRGVKLISAFVGIPGYLEYVYFEWCRKRGYSITRVLAFRIVFLVNLLIAIRANVPILMGK